MERHKNTTTTMSVSLANPCGNSGGKATDHGERDQFQHAMDREEPMQEMKKKALSAAALYKLSRYADICSLTWATVVLLGGFASSLKKPDFYLVSFLLLLQALQFTVSSTFQSLLFAHLFQESHHPNTFAHKDLQYNWASIVHIVGQILGFFFAAAVLVATFFRLAILPSLVSSLTSQSIHDIAPNMFASLVGFYTLVIITSALAILVSLFNLVHRSSSRDPAVVAFYDHIYRLAIDSHLASAYSMHPLSFALAKLRTDFERGIKPIVIQTCNKGLIDYIHKVPCGVEMAFQDLNSEDMYKQLVAVNLGRFWAKEPRMEKQVGYFVEIAKKLIRPEKLGEAAAHTLEYLAENWVDFKVLPDPPAAVKNVSATDGHVAVNVRANSQAPRQRRQKLHPFLEGVVDSWSGKTIVDELVELVVKPWRTSLVFQLRALESCCRNRQVVAWIRNRPPKENHYQELCKMLIGIIEGPAPSATRAHSKPKLRTKIYAASVLVNLLRPPNSESETLLCEVQIADDDVATHEKLRSLLETRTIDPANGSEKYVWWKEVSLLDMVHKEMGLKPYDWTSAYLGPGTDN